MPRADVCVVGLGAMGSMTLWRLAARGARVVGVDALSPPHDRGSSHGESRMIRTAYYEGEWYVPLVRAAFALWRRLEAESGAAILTVTGAAMIGPHDGELVEGTLRSAARHRLRCTTVRAREAADRLPQHVLHDGDVAVLEEEAGVLRPEAAVAAALDRARALGASVRTTDAVTAVTPRPGGGVGVSLASGETVEAGAAVVAAGPWTSRLVPALARALRVERQVQVWLPVAEPAAFGPDVFPVFCHEVRPGALRYGLPSLDGRTVKVAVHHEGAGVDPDTVDRAVTDTDLAPVLSFVAERMRGVEPRADRTAVCMYTDTPDEHFAVGSAPGLDGVVVLAGFSGHGFKFAPVIGDIAADLATAGGTRHDIDAFHPGRLLHHRQPPGAPPSRGLRRSADRRPRG